MGRPRIQRESSPLPHDAGVIAKDGDGSCLAVEDNPFALMASKFPQADLQHLAAELNRYLARCPESLQRGGKKLQPFIQGIHPDTIRYVSALADLLGELGG